MTHRVDDESKDLNFKPMLRDLRCKISYPKLVTTTALYRYTNLEVNVAEFSMINLF